MRADDSEASGHALELRGADVAHDVGLNWMVYCIYEVIEYKRCQSTTNIY